MKEKTRKIFLIAILFIIILFVILIIIPPNEDEIDNFITKNGQQSLKVDNNYPESPASSDSNEKPKIGNHITENQNSEGDKINIDQEVRMIADSLSLDKEEIEQERESYKNNANYLGWISRLHETLGDIGEVENQLKQEQLSSLFIKEKIEEKYLKSEISYNDYQKSLLFLYDWSDNIYKSILDDEQYQKLFGNDKNETEAIVKETVLRFPDEIEIISPGANVEEIHNNIPEYKLDEIKTAYKKKELDTITITKRLDAGELTKEEAFEEFDSIYNQYMDLAKSILDTDEFNLIFNINH